MDLSNNQHKILITPQKGSLVGCVSVLDETSGGLADALAGCMIDMGTREDYDTAQLSPEQGMYRIYLIQARDLECAYDSMKEFFRVLAYVWFKVCIENKRTGKNAEEIWVYQANQLQEQLDKSETAWNVYGEMAHMFGVDDRDGFVYWIMESIIEQYDGNLSENFFIVHKN